MSVTVDRIRNLVLVGHSGVGKTILAEALLHAAGAIPRMGTIVQGNTVCDFDDLEKERKHSIDSAVAHLEYKNHEINLIDTPGYPDFVGQALCGLAGAETAVTVISAPAGIEMNTRRLMAASAEFGLARMVVVNKIDADNLDLPALVQTLQITFGKNLLPLNLPAENGTKIISCLDTQPAGVADFDDVETARLALTEAIVENDEALMEKYLAGEQIPQENLNKALKSAIVAGNLVPILFTSADKQIGITELLETILAVCPSPVNGLARYLITDKNQASGGVAGARISPDPAGPVIGQVFKTFSDPRSNIKYSVVRLHSGTLKPDSSFHVNDDRKSFRPGHIFLLRGQETTDVNQVSAGQIFALAKIDELHIGHTVHIGSPGTIAMPNLPIPMFALAVEPKSRGDEQKISGALARLGDEDKTFRVDRDRQTHELVAYGTGDLHLRVLLQRMERRFKLEVNTKPPKIPYRETVVTKAEGHYRHKKQTGGAGQFGEVYLKVEPKERNTGFEFVDEIFGGSIPGQYLPAIEKGVRDLLDEGILAGFPVQDICIRVYDGKHHPVDSKEIAFRIAGKLAAKDAMLKANPVLLEPIVNIEVTVPSQYVGDITGDLSGRRGRISGQEILAGGMTLIKAMVPLAEVAQYNSQLRSVTGGQGSYAMELSHYDVVPPNIQQEIIKQHKPKAAEEEK